MEQFKSNATVLIGAYQVIYMQRAAKDVYEGLKQFEPFMPFRDASMGMCYFKLMPKHCIRAIEKALGFGWIDFESFNVDEYEYFECVENGDLNTIIPDKFIAFATPYSDGNGIEGYPTLAPEDYFPIWERYKVNVIVRLNKEMYNKKRFTNKGFTHHDMFFIDGTTPSKKIVENFLDIVENSNDGPIAVHCKAGLGRTGSLMGLYIMKHYKLTAAETIAWIRLCRPGSVIGPQQHYLKQMEQVMWNNGETEGLHEKLKDYPKSPSPKMSKLSIKEKCGDHEGATSPRKKSKDMNDKEGEKEIEGVKEEEGNKK